MSPATIRNGSIRISPACSATSARRRARRWPRARRSICASTRSRPTATAAAEALADLAPEPTRWSPHGLRIRLKADAKSPAVHAEPAFLKGLIEVQDEGSQLAALFARAKPGEQVLDLCAGGGGKTLALAAAMENKGQLYATDDDKRRLAPIHDRLARSGARNVQVRTPKSVGTEIDDLAGPHGPGADRRALHRHRRLAAQSGRQMAGAAGRAGAARQGAGRVARPRRGAGEAGRPHRLRHLLGAGRGERRSGPRISSAATPSFPWKSPAETGERRWASAPICSAGRRCCRTKGC